MGLISAFRFVFQNIFFTPFLYGIIGSLAIFAASWERADKLKDQITEPFRSRQDTFDFIIVGGGSAGAVLAYRLSEQYTVLLLEAGGESHPFQAIPAFSLFIPNYPATDWSYRSIPQTSSCLACVNKRYTFSAGKNLGGSGNLNYLIHLRGSPQDYDNWAQLTGDPRWSYDNVLEDFKISENFVGRTTDGTAHGVGGPLQIQLPSDIGLANLWNEAARELNVPHLDLNGRYEEGSDAIHYPIKNGVRQATYRSFILPIRQRKSLLIRKFATVTRLLIKEEGAVAYGVAYDRHGSSHFAFANKEVLLSAGALATPKILMLSGIGPRGLLEPLGISPRADLPVGMGFQNHISTLLGPFHINSKAPFSFDEDVTPGSFLHFIQGGGKGALSTSGFQATALLASTAAAAAASSGNRRRWPDIQLTLLGISPHRLFPSDFAHAFGLKESILQKWLSGTGASSASSSFFILVTVARPESRGNLCLSSKDPYQPLLIDPNFYSERRDMELMLEGIQRALHLVENTTTFANCGAALSPNCFPGCERHTYRSEGYWECYARHLSITLGDYVGTARMGVVVDSELRVTGVKGLRVVDASVMPAIPGANVQAATIMIAEKAARYIARDWGQEGQQQQAYGPPDVDTAQNYGPPPNSNNISSAQAPSGNSVFDDTLYIGLTPPPPAPDGGGAAYLPGQSGGADGAYYDSFDLLRAKGMEAVTAINLKGEEPEVTFTTPALYQEVYDPSVGATESTPTVVYFEDYATPTNPSTSARSREPKAFEFEEPTPTLSQTEEDVATGTSTKLSSFPDPVVLWKKRPRPRPPAATVHPRGHLGYEDETKEYTPPYTKSTSPPPPSDSTSSSISPPLPKHFILIKERRKNGTTTVRKRRKKIIGTSSTRTPNEGSTSMVLVPISTTTSPTLREVSWSEIMKARARMSKFIRHGGSVVNNSAVA